MSKRARGRPRPSQWARAAVLFAFAGGILGGFGLQIGLSSGWTSMAWGLGGSALASLIVADRIARPPFKGSTDGALLPGEIYANGISHAPGPPPSQLVGGRVPFQAGKHARPKRISADPVLMRLQRELDTMNGQLQRAAVNLGLGQISEEGYSLIVADLKKRRADVERKLNEAMLSGH